MITIKRKILSRQLKIAEYTLPGYIFNIPNKENKVFLTFDDGPVKNETEWVLDLLKKYEAKATFFCVGENVMKNPDIYKRIIEEGHSIGCHTYNHLNSWKISNDEYISSIKKAKELITTNLFRPPYGRLRPAVKKVISKDYKIILWDVLSMDYSRDISEEECLDNVKRNIKSGSIVVFHDSPKSFKNLSYALPKTLDLLKEKALIPDRICLK